MSHDDDRRERTKLSYSERDRRLRDKQKGHDERPQSPAARARSEAAAKKYVKQLDGMFAKGKGGAQGDDLARALRAAHGTPGLAAACAAYREAIGMPADAGLLALFLDCGEADLVLAALGELESLHQAGKQSLSAGQRSQLRMLALSSDDLIADAAEDLLGSLT